MDGSDKVRRQESPHYGQYALDRRYHRIRNAYPRNNVSDGGATGARPFQQAGGYFVTGQAPGETAVHTGGDIPLSAYGRGAGELGGTLDNTDVFFAVTKALIGGTTK